MTRIFCVFLMLLPAFAKTPVDLMLEGRYVEARAILDTTRAEPRYHLLLDAMTEPNAVRACSLYAVISQRFAGSDCDSLAQSRLQLAAAVGVPIKPVDAAEPVPQTTAKESAPPEPEIKPLPVKLASEPSPTVRAAAEPLKSSAESAIKPHPATVQPHDKLSATPGEWFAQVGAFGNHENARKLAAKLEQDGYGIALVPKTTNSKELLQVRVGGFASRDECKRVAEELKNKYNLSAAIVTE